MSPLRFEKPPRSLADQVVLLQSRGLLISDPESAKTALLRLNYYRFTGYALHYEVFENGQRIDRFKEGATFEQVIQLYAFDTELRALLFRYIEPVEIAFRTAVCYELAMSTQNSHWYLDPSLYEASFCYDRARSEWEREYGRSREIFVESYRAKYSDPPLPPAWMMCEILSMGSWSLIFKYVADREAKKAVARHFGISAYFLESWIHVLTVLRNLCAHHCRIWNRRFEIRPRLPTDMKGAVGNNSRLAAQVLVLSRLLMPLGQNGSFEQEWRSLQDAYPDVPREPMGLLQTTQRRGQP